MPPRATCHLQRRNRRGASWSGELPVTTAIVTGNQPSRRVDQPEHPRVCHSNPAVSHESEAPPCRRGRSWPSMTRSPGHCVTSWPPWRRPPGPGTPSAATVAIWLGSPPHDGGGGVGRIDAAVLRGYFTSLAGRARTTRDVGRPLSSRSSSSSPGRRDPQLQRPVCPFRTAPSPAAPAEVLAAPRPSPNARPTYVARPLRHGTSTIRLRPNRADLRLQDRPAGRRPAHHHTGPVSAVSSARRPTGHRRRQLGGAGGCDGGADESKGGDGERCAGHGAFLRGWDEVAIRPC